MKILHIQLYILMLLIVFILYRLLQVIYINANTTQNTEVDVLYQLTSKESNCLGSTEQYYFFLPGCEVLLPGSLYSVSGRVRFNSDNSAYAKKRLMITQITPKEIPAYSVEYWRSIWIRLCQRIELTLEVAAQSLLEENTAGMAMAMLLGRKQHLTPNAEELFKTTGTQHIVAISGYNFSIIVLSLSELLRQILKKNAQAAVLLVVIAAFAGFVGAQASVMRAAIMSSGSVLARLVLQRRYLPQVWIATAALSLALVRPTWLLEPGFQLSFVATASLVWGDNSSSRGLTQKMIGTLPETSASRFGLAHFLQEAHEAILIGFRIFLFTAPITLLHFQQVSLLGVFATASVAWLLPIISREGFAVVVLAAVFSRTVWLLPVISGALQVVLELPLQLFIKILEFFSHWQVLQFEFASVPWWSCVAWYGVLLGWWAMRRYTRRPVVHTLALGV